MGNWWSSDEGSLSSVSVKLAFPASAANQYHRPTVLSRTADGAFYAPITGHSNNKAIIFCHGNATTVTSKSIEMMKFIAEKISVDFYLLEYPGYGEAINSGTPNPTNCVLALSSLHNEIKDKYSHIYVMGHSIGTGVAVRFANQTDYQLAGVILFAAYKSIVSVPFDNESIETTLSSSNFYRNLDNISSVEAPVLLLHGTDDTVIPVNHSEALFLNLDPKYKKNAFHKLENVGHGDLQMVKIWDLVAQFVE